MISALLAGPIREPPNVSPSAEKHFRLDFGVSLPVGSEYPFSASHWVSPVVIFAQHDVSLILVASRQAAHDLPTLDDARDVVAGEIRCSSVHISPKLSVGIPRLSSRDAFPPCREPRLPSVFRLSTLYHNDDTCDTVVPSAS